MLYYVKITFNQYAPDDIVIDGEYTGAYINDNSEMLFLYSHYLDENGEKTIERISIPLHAVETLEIKPIYENSR